MAWPRATLEVTVIALVVFALQFLSVLVGIGIELFALSAPLTQHPWTIITSVYAHVGVVHLLGNLAGILVFGTIVEQGTSRLRFHGFVLASGAMAGIAEVLVGSLVGPAPIVLGISGAVMALMGYAAASNRVTDGILGVLRVRLRTQIVLIVVFALLITWTTGGERVAVIAHFTGFVVGLVAGRTHLLRPA